MHFVEHLRCKLLLSHLNSSNMNKIYFFQAILTFVKSLIGIFVPVYMYSLGYSLQLIFIFMLCTALMYLVFFPFTIKVIQKCGFKLSLLLTIPIYLSHIYLLNYLDTFNMIYYHLSWISFGLYSVLFWPIMHFEISVNSSTKHSGNQIGNLQILITLVSALAPLIGGYFLEFLSLYQLIILSFFLIFIGSLPLLFSKDIKLKHCSLRYRDYIRILTFPKFKDSRRAFMAEGIQAFIGLSLWPIIMFILLKNNFFTLGVLFTIVPILSIIFMYFSKKYTDSKKKSQFIKQLLIYKSFSWIVRSAILISGPIWIFILEPISRIINKVFTIPFYSLFYLNSKKVNTMDYIILRDLSINIAKVLVISFAILLSIVLVDYVKLLFFILFFIGFISSFYLAYLKEL